VKPYAQIRLSIVSVDEATVKETVEEEELDS
jgi:hypothetical protein